MITTEQFFYGLILNLLFWYYIALLPNSSGSLLGLWDLQGLCFFSQYPLALYETKKGQLAAKAHYGNVSYYSFTYFFSNVC